MKDYYDILEVKTSATIPEIKKSFRRLAQQYHPDKNQNDPYASSQFNLIKEAYEVLTNPSKKEYYLQQRWYDQSIGKRKKEVTITPVAVLKQSLELERYVAKLDVFRMDKPGLEAYITDLLTNDRINQLKQFDESETISQIVQSILRTINSLPYKNSQTIITQLEKLTQGNDYARNHLSMFSLKTKRKFIKEKYTLLFIISITIILCLLIFWAGR